MVPSYAASTLVCVQILVDMVDWNKPQRGSGDARVRWNLNTSTILALQTISTFLLTHFFLFSFMYLFLLGEQHCYINHYWCQWFGFVTSHCFFCFFKAFYLRYWVVGNQRDNKGRTHSVWSRSGWVYHCQTAPPNAARSSTRTRWWRHWRAALRGVCGRSWPHTATMRRPWGMPLVAPPCTWHPRWARRPCWLGC